MDILKILSRSNASSVASFFLYGHAYEKERVAFEKREPAIFAKFQSALNRGAAPEELSAVFAECAEDLALLYTEVGMGLAARMNTVPHYK